MTPSTLRRRATARLVASLGVWLCARPVAAHGTAGPVGGSGIDLVSVLVVVTTAGVLVGTLAALGSDWQILPQGSDALGLLAGPLLAGIGVTAVASTVLQHPLNGAGGGVLGATLGVLVASRGRCGLCADVAIGAVAIHRFVEGVTLAALSATGSSVSRLGVVVLSAHTVAECLAIGGQPGQRRTRAVAAVVFVQAVFVLSAGLGTLGVVTASSLPESGALAAVGGLLAVLGTTEVRLSTAGSAVPGPS